MGAGESKSNELFKASLNGDVETVKRLVERVNVNKTKGNSERMTPLHVANSKEITELLLKHGAEMAKASKGKGESSGQHPLHTLTLLRNTSAITVLIENGVNVNVKNKEGETAMSLACRRGYPEVIHTLADHGAAVDDKLTIDTSLSLPMIHLALSQGRIQSVNTLLQLKANIESRDDFGRTPLLYAVDQPLHPQRGDQGRNSIVSFLLQQPMLNIHAVDVFGNNALHLAVYHGNDRAVTILCNNSDCFRFLPKEKNQQGQTPEELARALLHSLITYLSLLDQSRDASKRLKAPAMIDVPMKCGATTSPVERAQKHEFDTQLKEIQRKRTALQQIVYRISPSAMRGPSSPDTVGSAGNSSDASVELSLDEEVLPRKQRDKKRQQQEHSTSSCTTTSTRKNKMVSTLTTMPTASATSKRNGSSSIEASYNNRNNVTNSGSFSGGGLSTSLPDASHSSKHREKKHKDKQHQQQEQQHKSKKTSSKSRLVDIPDVPNVTFVPSSTRGQKDRLKQQQQRASLARVDEATDRFNLFLNDSIRAKSKGKHNPLAKSTSLINSISFTKSTTLDRLPPRRTHASNNNHDNQSSRGIHHGGQARSQSPASSSGLGGSSSSSSQILESFPSPGMMTAK